MESAKYKGYSHGGTVRLVQNLNARLLRGKNAPSLYTCYAWKCMLSLWAPDESPSAVSGNLSLTSMLLKLGPACPRLGFDATLRCDIGSSKHAGTAVDCFRYPPEPSRVLRRARVGKGGRGTQPTPFCVVESCLLDSMAEQTAFMLNWDSAVTCL